MWEPDFSYNKLNAEALTKLLNALPQRKAGDSAICFLYGDVTDEANHTDLSTPPELQSAFKKAKHWKLYEHSGGYGIKLT